ncbi:MAG TPA: gliding motility-associated ABC transporter ATP-binding subunit GldA [Bacteroidales bacterium]|nr:gliding motility-associated ABC transporter ATP-binding subunit GldA [Bacteroidales bacterium]
MSISVQNITKIYSKQKALDQISLEVKPGEIVGLLGPNGAGKSTLMKILTCFIPPTSGDASVCGFDILEQSMEVRKKVGYLPENNPLYLDLYVREFLNFCAGTHRIKSNIDGRIAEMIELTGLETEQHKRIGSLSKGYRQRVGLAQALLHDPEVLILDEPTSGLDPNQLLEIRNLIREIGKKKTVMMSTHIMQEVEAICNRVIIIHKGHIVADDTTQNLQHLSASRPVIRVEFSSPVASELILAIPGVLKASPTLLVRSGAKDHAGASPAWMLTPEADRDIRANVFQFAVDHQLTVLSLHQEEQRLEEVFQELTRN